MSSQKYHKFDVFLIFICNMKSHFGTNPIKNWMDENEWENNYPTFDNLSDDKKEEIRYGLNQVVTPLLFCVWNETCRMFLDYLKKRKDSPFQHVESLFARYKFQASVGNLPHMHAMLKIILRLITWAQK